MLAPLDVFCLVIFLYLHLLQVYLYVRDFSHLKTFVIYFTILIYFCKFMLYCCVNIKTLNKNFNLKEDTDM